MKRASLDSHQIQIVDDRLKYQNMLEEYLELQKEYVSKKRKLRTVQQKKEMLSAEVRFLKRRYTYLANLHSKEVEPKQDEPKLHNPYAPSRMHAEERSNGVNEVAFQKPFMFIDLNSTLGDKDRGSIGKVVVSKKKPQRAEKKNAGKKKTLV